jgi:hypothetical protein
MLRHLNGTIYYRTAATIVKSRCFGSTSKGISSLVAILQAGPRPQGRLFSNMRRVVEENTQDAVIGVNTGSDPRFTLCEGQVVVDVKVDFG